MCRDGLHGWFIGAGLRHPRGDLNRQTMHAVAEVCGTSLLSD